MKSEGIRIRGGDKRHQDTGKVESGASIVFEHFGLWATGSRDYLNQLSRYLLNYKNEAAFKNQLVEEALVCSITKMQCKGNFKETRLSYLK